MKKRLHSLSFRLPFIYISSYVIIALIIILIVYNRFERMMEFNYTRMAAGVTNLMAEALDTDKIDDFIENNYNSREYLDTLKYYFSLRDNYPDIYYLYIYRFHDDGDKPLATVVIDLDEEYTETPTQENLEWVGSEYEVDEPFASEMDKIIHGREPVSHVVHTQDGEHLLSYVRPILDENGNYLCSACVDFSMEYMHTQGIRFVIRLMGMLGVIMLIILIMNIYFIRKRITRPLERLEDCLDGFVYNTETDRFRNVQSLEELEIHLDNEIGKLYSSLTSSMKESLYYMTNLNRAKNEIEDKEKALKEISRMTFKDGLTGVGNKAAFMRDTDINDKEIIAGNTAFAVVVADVNNLKQINDTYGHDAGDKYISGCSRIICEIFRHSPVYRIGGDEFAVLLTGDDYEKRHDLYIHAVMDFNTAFSKKKAEPWERYSASLGLAEYKSGDTTGSVLKRADKMMYANKQAFRNKYGSYRA